MKQLGVVIIMFPANLTEEAAVHFALTSSAIAKRSPQENISYTMTPKKTGTCLCGTKNVAVFVKWYSHGQLIYAQPLCTVCQNTLQKGLSFSALCPSLNKRIRLFERVAILIILYYSTVEQLLAKDPNTSNWIMSNWCAWCNQSTLLVQTEIRAGAYCTVCLECFQFMRDMRASMKEQTKLHARLSAQTVYLLRDYLCPDVCVLLADWLTEVYNMHYRAGLFTSSTVYKGLFFAPL